MDNDPRDRRDWTEPETTADRPAEDEPGFGEATRPSGEPAEPSAAGAGWQEPAAWTDEASTETPASPAEEAREWPSDEPASSAADIESWPSQDVPAATHPTDVNAADPWPTEPPVAGAASTEGWPTTPPERGEEPADASNDLPRATEPPPGEAEAYPASSVPDAEAGATVAGAAGTAGAQVAGEAEGAVGEGTQCPRCGTENRPGLAFCRNCGQRLVAAGVATTVERPGTPEGTMGCPRCGTHNRAGVAFCQNCGANLRGTPEGYVPPAAEAEEPAVEVETRRRGAVLGPVVLIVGLIGLVTGYLLPFLYGAGSLFERAAGADGYGIAFWSDYPEVGAALADQAYFGLAGPVPLLALLLLGLAIAGFLRAAPGILQTIGLVIALLWSVGLIVLFLVVEVAGNWDGDLVSLLRVLSPAGIILFLASLIVLIGTLTRFARS